LAFVALAAVFFTLAGEAFFALVVAVAFLGVDLVAAADLVTVVFLGAAALALEDVVVVFLVVEVLVPDDLVVVALAFVAAAALVLAVVALGFATVVALGLAVVVVFDLVVAFGFVAVVVVVFRVEVVALGAGLISSTFSFTAAGLELLGTSLTLPEIPLGMTKTPFSTPFLRAREMLKLVPLSTTILYCCSI